jgi:hypothetical protein
MQPLYYLRRTVQTNQKQEEKMRLFVTSRTQMAALIAGSMLAGGLMTGTALAYQGHMLNALHALQNANAQLQAALPDKGGHRLNAINLVNQAIGEVQAAIAVGAE